MASRKYPLQNQKKRATVVMDKELDDSLQEILKLLAINARINLLFVKGNCQSLENEEELEYIDHTLNSIMSQWLFQQELK